MTHARPVGRRTHRVGRRRRPRRLPGDRPSATDGRALFARARRASSAGSSSEWSPFAKHMITGVYQTIRSIDATARERESLVALGTLAAGLAHEINNPASAALRAVEALRNAVRLHARIARRAGRARHAGRGVPCRSTGCASIFRTAGRRRRRDGHCRPRGADRHWLEDRGIEVAWQMAPVLARVRGRPSVARRARGGGRRRRARSGAALDLEHDRHDRPARRAQPTRHRGSPTSSRT